MSETTAAGGAPGAGGKGNGESPVRQKLGTPRAEPLATFPRAARRIALTLSFATGTLAGVLIWRDSQINQPCL